MSILRMAPGLIFPTVSDCHFGANLIEHFPEPCCYERPLFALMREATRLTAINRSSGCLNPPPFGEASARWPLQRPDHTALAPKINGPRKGLGFLSWHRLSPKT